MAAPEPSICPACGRPIGSFTNSQAPCQATNCKLPVVHEFERRGKEIYVQDKIVGWVKD